MKPKKVLNGLFIFMIGLMGGTFAILISNHIDGKEQVPKSLPSIPAHYASLTAPTSDINGPDFTKAAELTVNAVVHIKTKFKRRSSVYDDFFGFDQFFWGQRPPEQYHEGFGSGVIITDDGYIVTNNHVVQNAENITVTLNDKRTYSANIIGLDPTTDLALIKIDAHELPFIIMGNSDQVKIGEWVLAVGNPFNLTSTVTAGIVSAKGRHINILGGNTAIESYIQTDAAVNRGNSGGALVNIYGQLIGINAAIASNTGSYAGYSFAIPVDIVKKVVEDLMEFGIVQRAFLGITFAEVTSELAEEKNLNDIKGVYVMEVAENGAAREAGIEAGDIITKINETEITNSAHLQELIGRHHPGDKINVTIETNGKSKEIPVVLRNREGNTNIVTKETYDNVTILGATFEPISPQEASRLGISGGLKIIDLNAGKFRSQGIREGFILTHIDNKPVKSIESLQKILNSKSGGILIEGLYPNGMKAYYGFGL